MDFDLSRNKSLRILTVKVDNIDEALWSGSLDSASRLFKFALSSIQSPVFSQVSVFYRRSDLPARNNLESCNYSQDVAQAKKLEGALWNHKRFELLREMRKVQHFQLVLHVHDLRDIEGHVVRVLKEIVAAEKAQGGFNDHFPEPLTAFN